MKRICVTGSAGFIGSNYVRYKLAQDPSVHIVVFDKLTYAGNLDNLKDLPKDRYTFVKGDIADKNSIRGAMEGCDAIVNFAADTHVDRSIMGATDFISTNVTGVYNILEAARDLKLQRVLLVSTDEVYGSIRDGSFKETDQPRPRNPYSASKAGGDLMGIAHFETFHTPVIITRGSNTYGPFQYPEKVMPLFITNLIDGQQVPLYKGGEHNVRDWLFAEDHASGVDAALMKGEPGNIYNVAGGNERENIQLTERLLQLTGRGKEFIKLVPDRPGHDFRYSIDASKLRKLGWTPKMDWDKGVALTVDWYKNNEWWWRKIKSGEFMAYYKKQYEDRK